MSDALNVRGVGRVAEKNEYDSRTIEVYLDRRPTDDELRDIHELLAGRLTPSEKAKPESEEAKALIADAARYRWLKNAADVDVMDEILMQKIEEWDSLIDTQIAFDGVVPVRPERPE